MDGFEHNTEEEVGSDDETESQVKRNVRVGEKLFLVRSKDPVFLIHYSKKILTLKNLFRTLTGLVLRIFPRFSNFFRSVSVKILQITTKCYRSGRYHFGHYGTDLNKAQNQTSS